MSKQTNTNTNSNSMQFSFNNNPQQQYQQPQQQQQHPQIFSQNYQQPNIANMRMQQQQMSYLSQQQQLFNQQQQMLFSQQQQQFGRIPQQQQQYNQIPMFGAPQTGQQQIPSPNSFADDDQIEPTQQQAKQNQNYDLENNLEFAVKAQYKIGKLRPDQSQYLPGMISVKAKEAAQGKQVPKVGVDLLCLIDKSGSMQGQKIEIVRQTLNVLLNFLGEKDRLCLIEFESSSQRLTPLKCVSEKNKSSFRQVISQIQAGGGTQISSATQIAFQQIQQRKYKNNVTSIFILSDGQDNVARNQVESQLKHVQDVFTIHSFGFGSDHDADLMSSLSNLRNGSFYFVDNITLLDEFFIDALGGLVSVVGDQIEISMVCNPTAPFQNIKIKKTYGQMWKQLGNQQFGISIPQLASGTRKDYVFEIELPQFNGAIADHQRNCQVVQAQLKIKSTSSGQIVTKNATLNLTFFNQNEPLPQAEQDVDVASQYYRVKGSDVIDDARRACEQGQYQQAQVSIEKMLHSISSNKAVAQVSENLIQDLQQAKMASQPQNFSSYGMKQMCQISSNNYNQQGINAQFSGGRQVQSSSKSAYANDAQTSMLQQVQYSKMSKGN